MSNQQELTSQKTVIKALIAVGSNLPSGKRSPVDMLVAAVSCLEEHEDITQVHCSRFYATPAYPAGSGPEFANAAIGLNTLLPPQDLLELLHRIEIRLGRVRSDRWGARVIDLDLLAHGDTVHPDAPTQTRWRNLTAEAQQRLAPDGLILPHPRMQDRAFVLVPLMDVAPDWVHPVLGQSVAEMAAALPAADRAAITPL